MNGTEQVLLKRETKAIQIPDGNDVVLPEGSQVRIAQELGGNYTVVTPWGQMLRIDAKDADSLGKESEASQDQSIEGSIEDRLWAGFRTVYDPEIPVNIVELGLIYDVQVGQDPDGQTEVQIQMTLTAPGCGMGEIIARDVKTKASEIRGVHSVDVDIVFDPPWNPSMMTEAARLQLGFF